MICTRFRTTFHLIASVAVVVTACHARNSLDGYWESDGFGYVISISGRSLKAFEVTATTCVIGFTAHKVRGPEAGGAAAFRSGENLYFVRAGGNDRTRIFRQHETLADIHIRRVERLPVVCERPTPNTPEGNFEVFTKTWAENYISFERRGVNWSEVVTEYRQRINARTTPGELFRVFSEILERFADMHTYVSASSLKQTTRQFWRPGTDRVVKGGLDEFANRGRWKLFSLIDQINLHHATTMVCNRGLHYGDLGDGLGYLRIRSFGAYSRSNDAEALEGCLDSIFSAGRRPKSLVIDMRVAFGGSDELGLAIAKRLATQPYVAYTIRARSRAGEGWTAKQSVIVEPSHRPGFRGAVVVLTGPVTLSAAESFVLALFGRYPPVTRIGESTQGVFCDVLSRHLPNGWEFGLPNAVYTTIDGRTFDVTGIPPDISVPVFVDSDLQAGRDLAIETARRVLSEVH